MKKNLVLIYFLIHCLQVLSQPVSEKADTLRSILNRANFQQYPQLFEAFDKKSRKLTVSKAIEQAKDILRVVESEEQANPVLLMYANKYVGEMYDRTSMKGDALAYFQRALTIAKEHSLLYESGMMNLRLGKFYHAQDFLTEASECLYEANSIFEKTGDTVNLFFSHYTTSLIDYQASHYSQAIAEGEKAIIHFNRLKNKTRSDSMNALSEFNTMGLAAVKINNLDAAMDAFQKAERIAEQLKHEFWIGLINGNKAKIYRVRGLNELAIENLGRDFHISIKYKEWSSAFSAAITLSDILMDGKKWKEAKYYLDTAARFSEKVTNTRVKLRGAKQLGRYYEATGSLAKAMEMHKEAMRLMDTLVVENERANLGRFRARYELEEKKGEIDSLLYKNALQKKEIKSLNIMIWSAVIILSLVILLIVVVVRDSQRLKIQYSVINTQRKVIEQKNEKLEEQSLKLLEQNQVIGSSNQQLEEMVKERTAELELVNAELDRFLYHASHDIRRPIATLLGLSQVFQLSDKEHWQSLFEKVSYTALNMDNMLFKLQMAYELNKPLGRKTRIDIHAIVDETASLFHIELQSNSIDLKLVKGRPLIILSHVRLMQIILRNLVENAICFMKPIGEEKPAIRISLSLKDERAVCIEVEDNGIGIDSRYMERIFDLYFRGTEQSKGNGLGLYLAMKAATMLKGELKVKSQLGEGAVFTLLFPYEAYTG